MLSKLKPPWISGAGMWGLGIQFLAAGLVLYLSFGMCFGLFGRDARGGPFPSGLVAGMALWSVFACVAAYGIYRDRWWAFFLELAVLWAVMGCAIAGWLSEAAHHRPGVPFLDAMNAFTAVTDWLALLWFNWKLVKLGIDGFRKRHLGRIEA